VSILAVPEALVCDFVQRWQLGRRELRESITRYFSADTVWENVGLTRTIGVTEALALIDQFEATVDVATIRVEMRNLVCSGNVVMTERVDYMLSAAGREVGVIPVMGIFEVKDAKIQHWRDYFDHAVLTPKK
jgi:limonene-1,2-epoxide hydrolase